MAKTVVLIDDDPDDLDILQEVISNVDASIRCISFGDASEAVRAIANELTVVPDYVLTDINMPGMTGDQCVRELRKIKELNNTIIAVLSTSMQSDKAESLKALGANYTFQKPTKIAVYDKVLRQVLSSR